MKKFCFIIFILIGVLAAQSTGYRPDPESKFVLIPLDTTQQFVQDKIFAIKHLGLEKTDRIETFLKNKETASYKATDVNLDFMYRGPVWFRLDFFSSLPRVQKMTLANDRPLYHVLLVDDRGVRREFKPDDYRLKNTVKPFFDIEVPPGFSSIYMRLDTTGQVSTLAWRILGTETFRRENTNPENDIVLWIAPIFLSLYLAVFFVVFGVYQYCYLILGILSLLSLMMILGGYYPLAFFPDFFKLGNSLPLILALAMAGFNHFFRFLHNITFKNQTFLALVSSFFSLTYLVLGIWATIFPERAESWMITPVILGSLFNHIYANYYKSKHRLKLSLAYSLCFPPLTFGAIALGLQYLGFIPYFPQLLDFQFLAVIYFLMLMSLVIGLNVHQEKIVNAHLKQEMILGRSVQELFIPLKLEVDESDLNFKYRYQPFYGMMSGDWVKSWATQDGKRHFLIGDVAGKGPQAALAVGVIAVTIHLAMRHNQSLEDCLKAINGVLYRIFGGVLTTKATGVTITPHHRLYVYNAGGTGCYKIYGNRVQHLLTPGPVLGRVAQVTFDRLESYLGDKEILISYTDGFAPFYKSIRKMLKHFAQDSSDRDGTKLIDLMMERTLTPNPKDGDDKAVMVIAKK